MDDTKEFLANSGELAVHIALMEDGVPVVGVVAARVTRLSQFASDRRAAVAFRQ